MTNKTQIFSAITAEMNDLYAAKNADYGDSFGQTFDKLGIISAVTRISDKYNRLISLATKPSDEIMIKDEKIEDTLIKGDGLTFHTDDGMMLRPLYDTHNQRYVVYWDIE